VTVLDAIQRSSEFLAKKGVESPRLQVELMLAQLLELPRLKLYLNFDRPLDDGQTGQLRAMVQRRGQREPLQHILGSTCFCGLDFAVSPEALIPRQETELLCERAWQHLGAFPNSNSARPSALDMGTGTGCLAVTLAVKCPEATIHAADISGEALKLARQNAARHAVAERIAFHRSDLFSALADAGRFDLILSNPPYIPTAILETLAPEVRVYDPTLALDGGPDGLVYYRRLAKEAGAYLKKGGMLMVEFGDDQEKAIGSIFQENDWVVDELLRDLVGQLRIMIAHRDDC
jgi:release factor glutamine methyltransferase